MDRQGARKFRQNTEVLLTLLFLGLTVGIAAAQPVPTPSGQTNSVQAEMESAIHRVEAIVNQPVAAYRRAPGMHVSVYSPGWFHPGATKPDFNSVDVRSTQETPYASHQYVTSELNPGIVFPGSELEFNAMTKYFYTNRTLPKKKLTDAEMQEINRLYRVIGRCEAQLAPAGSLTAGARTDSSEHSDPADSSPSNAGKRPRLLNPYLGAGGIVLLVVVLLLTRKGR